MVQLQTLRAELMCFFNDFVHRSLERSPRSIASRSPPGVLGLETQGDVEMMTTRKRKTMTMRKEATAQGMRPAAAVERTERRMKGRLVRTNEYWWK